MLLAVLKEFIFILLSFINPKITGFWKIKSKKKKDDEEEKMDEAKIKIKKRRGRDERARRMK